MCDVCLAVPALAAACAAVAPAASAALQAFRAGTTRRTTFYRYPQEMQHELRNLARVWEGSEAEAPHGYASVTLRRVVGALSPNNNL